jgi:hypothetical protein
MGNALNSLTAERSLTSGRDSFKCTRSKGLVEFSTSRPISSMNQQLKNLRKWLRTLLSGKPHFVVGTQENPYLLRWYLVPRNRFLNLYLHKFMRDDDDRALHDHPWKSLSIILKGGYLEFTDRYLAVWNPGDFIFRSETHAHRIALFPTSDAGKTVPCWTLFITGPRVRNWGFHCPKGWVSWQKFTAAGRPGEIGPGCGE